MALDEQELILCRVCESTQDLVDITMEKFIHLNEKLNKIFDFKPTYSCFLKFICIPCSLQLENSFNFKTQNEKTFYKLMHQLQISGLLGSNIDCCDGIEEQEERKYSDLFEIIRVSDENETDSDQLQNSWPESTVNDYDHHHQDQDLMYLPQIEKLECHTEEPPNLEGTNPEVLPYVEGVNMISEKTTENPKTRLRKTIKRKLIYTCALCNKTYTQKHNLHDHIINKHLNRKPYRCNVCDREFRYNAEFYVHKKGHNGHSHRSSKEIQRVTCNICGKSLQISSLKNHMKIHANIPKVLAYLCHVCGHASTIKSAHDEHFRIHTDEKIYKCDQCDKSFTQKIGLTSHKRIHSDSRPYKCHLCPKTFVSGAHLKQHNYTHTGERKHNCQVCGKGFRQPHDVRAHMRIHTGETPYQCPHCSKKLAQKKSLTNHMKTCTAGAKTVMDAK